MTAARPPLLTDEEIATIAEKSSVEIEHVAYQAGARFARSIYEPEITKLLDRIAEAISLMKEAAPAIDTISSGLSERFDRFLAIYAKEDKP